MIALLVACLAAGLPAGETEVRIHPLKSARAADVESLVAAAFRLRPDVRITSDPQSNSVIATADAATILVIEEMIRKLDVPKE